MKKYLYKSFDFEVKNCLLLQYSKTPHPSQAKLSNSTRSIKEKRNSLRYENLISWQKSTRKILVKVVLLPD